MGLLFDQDGENTVEMNFEKFTIKSEEALQKSQRLRWQAEPVHRTGAHLKAILETDENVSDYLFKKLNVNSVHLTSKLDELLASYPVVTGQQPYLSPSSNSVLQNAERNCVSLKTNISRWNTCFLPSSHRRTRPLPC